MIRCKTAVAEAAPLPFCTPSCTRWQSINDGTPVPYFIEMGGWAAQKAFYPNLTQSTPDQYILDAIDFWQVHMEPGRQLMVRTMVQADSLVRIRFINGTGSDNQIADMLCICSDNDTHPCVDAANHDNVFSSSNPCIGNFYNEPIVKTYMNDDFYRQVWAHEFGHGIIAMSHEYNTGYESIMGDINDFKQSISTHDIEELQHRYPSGCTLTKNKSIDFKQESDFIIRSSSETGCKICCGESHKQ